MFLLVITIISLTIAFFILNLFRRDNFLYFTVFLIYLFWHLPLIISIILPFDYYLVKNDFNYILVTIFFLLSIHLIMGGGSIAYHQTYKVIRKNQYAQIKDNVIFARKYPYHLLIYFPLSYLSCVLAAINAIYRGLSLSIESIAENRLLTLELESEQAQSTPYSFLGGFLSGFTYYLLLFSIENVGGKIVIRWIYIIPFSLYSAIIFLSGSKSFILFGMLIIILKFIYEAKTSFKQAVTYFCVFSVLISSISFIHQSLRSTSFTLDAYNFLEILGIKSNSDHPLHNYIKGTQSQANLGFLYLYYGVEYDMLYVVITSVDSFSPLGSLTVPALYRRWKNFFGLPDEEEVRLQFHDLINRKYGVFPRTWGTMFMPIYLEGGLFYIIIIVMLLAMTHFKLLKKYVKNPNKDLENKLIIFYLFLMWGLMIFPLTSTSNLSLLIAIVMAPYIRVSIKNFFFDYR